jgi:hypothetical protein
MHYRSPSCDRRGARISDTPRGTKSLYRGQIRIADLSSTDNGRPHPRRAPASAGGIAAIYEQHRSIREILGFWLLIAVCALHAGESDTIEREKGLHLQQRE